MASSPIQSILSVGNKQPVQVLKRNRRQRRTSFANHKQPRRLGQQDANWVRTILYTAAERQRKHQLRILTGLIVAFKQRQQLAAAQAGGRAVHERAPGEPATDWRVAASFWPCRGPGWLRLRAASCAERDRKPNRPKKQIRASSTRQQTPHLANQELRRKSDGHRLNCAAPHHSSLFGH